MQQQQRSTTRDAGRRVTGGRAALVAGTCLALVGACTAEGAGPSPSGSPSPTAEAAEPVHVAELRLPAVPATVVTAEPGVERAVAVSSAFFASAPVVVVAPADDVPAQLRAASIGVALGAPVLLDDADPGQTLVQAEVDRLAPLAVVTVGDADVDVDGDDLVVVPAPQDDDRLAAVLDTELTTTEAPAPGGETAWAAALDPAAPALAPAPLASGTTEGTGGVPQDAEGPQGAEGSQGAQGAGATGSPTATPEPSATPPAASEEDLPVTEQPDPLDGGLLLTTGDARDVAAVATARAAGVDVLTVPSGDPRATADTVSAVAAAAPAATVGLGAAFGDDPGLEWRVATAATGTQLPGGGQVLFPGRRMVALYGTPGTSALGLLGEQDLRGSIARAQDLAAQYQPLTDDVVVPAFEMIVTVASAGAGDDGNYSNELPVETFIPWIEEAAAAGIYVIIDLQPGRTDFVTQAKAYETLLRYPNVGLALDPEWRLKPDQVHLRQIGSVTVEEVNAVADHLAQLTRENRLPQKLLVLHQFQLRMIQGRERLDMSHPELALMVHADGQGSQPAKADTWRALRANAPQGLTWGWKNFIDEDLPMLTPEQTYAVEPIPELVTYQ